MKTAREKAKEIVDDLPFAVVCHRAHIERAIAAAIIVQDRDTRHACVEAVNEVFDRLRKIKQPPPTQTEVVEIIMNVKTV